MRDQFAMAALQGLLAHHGKGDGFVGEHGSEAYVYADAMLVQRAKGSV